MGRSNIRLRDGFADVAVDQEREQARVDTALGELRGQGRLAFAAAGAGDDHAPPGPAPGIPARADRDAEVVKALDELVELAARPVFVPGRELPASGGGSRLGQGRDHPQHVELQTMRQFLGVMHPAGMQLGQHEQAYHAEKHPHRRGGHHLEPVIGVGGVRRLGLVLLTEPGDRVLGLELDLVEAFGHGVEHGLGPVQILAGELQRQLVGPGRLGLDVELLEPVVELGQAGLQAGDLDLGGVQLALAIRPPLIGPGEGGPHLDPEVVDLLLSIVNLLLGGGPGRVGRGSGQSAGPATGSRGPCSSWRAPRPPGGWRRTR